MKDGTYPIYICVCYHGRKELKTGVSCSLKDWDGVREVVKKGCSNHAVLNKMLSDIKQRVIDKRNRFEYDGMVYTPSMLLDGVYVDHSGVGNVYRDIMESLIGDRRLKYKTRCKYVYAYSKLVEFIGRDDFLVDELTVGVVKDFVRWLDVADGTKRSIVSCIASVWNYGIDRKLVDGGGYPFDEYKFTSNLKDGERDYFLSSSHIVRLKEYWLNLVVDRSGSMWHYKDGAFDRLRKRTSKEFGILWFLLCYKLNGSAPTEIGHLRSENCRMVNIGGVDYWAIDFKRQKTGVDVHVRWKRDMFSIIALEHFLGSCGGYVYPIVSCKAKDDVQINRSISKASESAIKWVRETLNVINGDIIRENVEKGLSEPLIESERVVLYTARHSFACQYLSSSGASVRGLASLMARSPNSIGVYIHQLTKDVDIAKEVECMPI